MSGKKRLLHKIFAPAAIRKGLKRIGRAVALVVLAALLYMAMAFLLSRIGVPAEQIKAEEVTVFVLSNGVHADFVMPVKSEVRDWSREVKFANTRGKDTLFRYVGIGWGNKRFYMETPTWADLTVRTAFSATLGLGRSAIHATFYKDMMVYDKCVKIGLTMEQYGRLVVYIDSSFARDADGHYRLIVTDANYGESDAFYEANGRFSMFCTCNTWVNSGLKACGQRACVWTPFEDGVFYQCRRR